MTAYPHLFSQFQVGSVTIRNRIMQTGHAKLYSVNGVDSQRDLDYHVERAKGGIGLIITGNRFVHPTSCGPTLRYSWGYEPSAIAGDRRITRAVQAEGARIFAQLNHFGINATSDGADDVRVTIGPSAVKSPGFGEVPKVMEPSDIREITVWWGRCAEYSREAEFDGVEIHLSHGYLLHQFLSPLYNKRTDEYGGSLENRARFANEVLNEVRRQVGSDYVVGVRMSLTDCVEGGLEISDAIEVAQLLERRGDIDFINVTAGGPHDGYVHAIAPSDLEDGWLIDLTAQLKVGVPRLPVFVVGGIKEAALAEAILAQGKADMVAMTRAQIADPEFARKVLEGREDEIYHCIRGNQGCIARDFRGLPVGCTVNPATGREARFGRGRVTPAASSAQWVVAGGGPAGMKAAEMLARRGHKVVLLERASELGGQVNLILRTPGREGFAWLVRDLQAQLDKLGVEIRLGFDATPDVVQGMGPGGVIVATGAIASSSGFTTVLPLVDRLRGVERRNVLTAWDVLRDEGVGIGRTVVLDDDGGRYAAGVAEALLDRGAQVEVVSRFGSLFPGTVYTLEMPVLVKRLLGKGLGYRLHSWATEIADSGIEVMNLFTGERETVEADYVVLATSPEADETLYFGLAGIMENVHRVGDCVAPRKLDHAIYDGYLAGLELFSAEERYISEGTLESWRDGPGLVSN